MFIMKYCIVFWNNYPEITWELVLVCLRNNMPSKEIILKEKKKHKSVNVMYV